MKKSLFFMISLVVMLFSMTTLTSCSSDPEYGVVVECKCGIDVNPYGTISAETEQALIACKERIDQRLVKMFGKTFSIKTDEKGDKIDEAEFKKYNERIDKDATIQEEIKKLQEFKTEEGEGAVWALTFYYISGTHIYGEFVLE